MRSDSAQPLPAAARRAARSAGAPLLLAVSGGRDSMALLVAMAEAARAQVAAVATFDHGTGPAATEAAAHVARVSAAYGIPCVMGHMPAAARAPDGWEAAWRAARHGFLADCARALGARVATAHTADDQVETVLMRVLRGSGARGLAGLAAPSPIVRPFLAVPRAAMGPFLAARGVAWVEDPGNASPAFLRNRVRHDLLPALRRANATIDAELLEVGRRAAAWRGEVDAVVEASLRVEPRADGGLSVAAAELAGYDRDSLAMLWGSLASRAGLALDRRGTLRLAMFTMKGGDGGEMPLSGGWTVERRREAFVLRRASPPAPGAALLPAVGEMRWGRFRFRAAEEGAPAGRGGAMERGCWTAALPAGTEGRVRAWRAGDRLAASLGQPRRRVTRYLSEAGVRGSDRAAWPVVVDAASDADVVWIPGVRRADAATERSGRPVRHYVCERIAP